MSTRKWLYLWVNVVLVFVILLSGAGLAQAAPPVGDTGSSPAAVSTTPDTLVSGSVQYDTISAPNGRVYVAVYQDDRVYSWPTFTLAPTPTQTPTQTTTPTTNGTTNGTPTRTAIPTTTHTTTQSANILLSVDLSANRYPISPDIYGMNTYLMPSPASAYMQSLGVPVRRWGGNATSRYNWKLDVSNTAMDWYFENYKESNSTTLPDDSAVNRFVDQNKAAGVDSLLTLPMIGYTAKDDHACSFSVQKYGTQQGNDSQWRPDCGNGILANGQPVATPNPLDASIPITSSWVTDWIAYLTNRNGSAANGGIRFYNLDNEPDLWWETHRDVQPTGWKYQEFRDRSQSYAAAIRAADPSAQILGPAVNGWTYYFYGAYDAQRQDWASPDDRLANGDVPFIPWYLQQMKAYDDAHAIRLLDYLDMHYYPQADGVSLATAGDAATQAKRLRSTRSLWDPIYVDESWISSAGPEGGIIKLIPRMKEWLNANYPGTKLAIGEYNWGGLEDINGALAQADVLGLFGREGLDLATLWQPPALNEPGAFAFRIFRNYDGQHSQFGNRGVDTASTDQSQVAIYAAQRDSDKALTMIVINKTDSVLAPDFTILGPFSQFSSVAQVYRYSSADLSAIQQMADQPVLQGSISASFPAYSITLFVLPFDKSPLPEQNLFLPQIAH